MQQRRVGKIRNEFFETVLINDTVFDSQYFRIDDMPQELTAGKNMFKIYGDNELLVPGSNILIQVTDSNGAPIYHHVNDFVDTAGRIVIGIWIYPETPPGLGRIEVIGKARRRPQGNLVPPNWANRYNVKWSRDVIFSPEKPNKTPILFKQIPGIAIREQVREYLTQTYLSGTSIATQDDGNITYSYNGIGDATVTIAGAQFSASMAGGLLTVPVPNVSLPNGMAVQTGASTDYSAYVSSVVNSNTIRVAPHILPVTSTQTVSSNISGNSRSNATQISTVNTIYPVTTFGPVSNYTMSWQQDATYTAGSLNSQSFANITIKNMDPMVGKVHSIKTYMRSHGYADYIPMSQEILQERDLLINVDSGLQYDRVGDYKSQEIINEYWESGSINQSIAFANKHDDSQMISAMVITGSDLLSGTTGYPLPPRDTDPYIKVSSIPNIDVYGNNEYQVKFRVEAEAYAGQISSSYMDIYISGSNIGASDARNIGQKLITLESTNAAPGLVSSVAQFNNISSLIAASSNINVPALSSTTVRDPGITSTVNVPASFSPNTIQNVNVNDVPSIDERLLELSFTPDLDSDAHIVFAVVRGKWYISDVSLEGATDYGFTPNHTFIEFPIQSLQADDVLDFKFEFYNTSNDLANITVTTQSMDFVGSNLFIDGNGNQLSGSVAVGNGIVMQGYTGR